MRHLKTVLAVLGAATILVLAANTVAIAATGNALLGGKFNSAGKVTILKRTTPGPVLSIQSKKATNPPLAVNGRGKVANLNADTVDGFDSARLRNRAYVFTSTAYTNKNAVAWNLPLPSGTYSISYSNFINDAAAGGVECYIWQDNASGVDITTGFSSIVHTVSSGWDPALTGTGIATKTSTNKVYVSCDAQNGNTFDTDTSLPMRIVATQVEIVSSKTITPQDGLFKVKAKQ